MTKVEKDKVEPKKEDVIDVFSKPKEIVKGKKVAYTPSRVYELIFPNGLQLYYNRVVIGLVFDGRTYKFTEPVISFIEKRLSEIAKQETKKKKQFNNPIFGKISE